MTGDWRSSIDWIFDNGDAAQEIKESLEDAGIKTVRINVSSKQRARRNRGRDSLRTNISKRVNKKLLDE